MVSGELPVKEHADGCYGGVFGNGWCLMETKRSESASAFRPRPLCYTPLFSFPPQTRSHSHALTLTHGHSLPPAMYHSRPSGMMVALPHPYLSTELMIVDLVWPRAPQPTASSEPRKWESLRPAGSEVCVLPPIPACSNLSVGGCVALQRVPCYLNAASYDSRASCGGGGCTSASLLLVPLSVAVRSVRTR